MPEQDVMTRMLRPMGYEWTVGAYKAADISSMSAEIRELVEAVMMLAYGLRDEDGKHVTFRIPAALALAIVQTLRAPQPLEFALSVVSKIGSR